MEIVASKLSPHPSAARSLTRCRLTATVEQGTGATLVLVRAPAGFGKTTFMAELTRWLQSQRTATAWLTLDKADNDVSRFITYMIAAFQSIDPALALLSTTPTKALRRGTNDGASLDLVQHISMQTTPFAVFLDNFEVIQSPTVLGIMRMLLDATPALGQFIISSRDTPELGLGRMRAHGHLLEIGVDDLRFSLEESRSLLQIQRQLPITDEQVAMLQKRTDGWAAGLWLAAVSLRDRNDANAFIRSFSGSNAAVADYLLEDVLSRQPEPERRFLLAISVLDELYPPLCDHVTGRKDSHNMLAKLEKASLFVLPQNAERSSYRYHTLFRDFLYAQLRQADPQRVVALHVAAAQWHLDHEQPVQAMEQAIRSGDERQALEYLSRFAEPLLWQGRVRLLARLFDRLPPTAAARADAHLKLIWAWALTLTRCYKDAIAQLNQLDPCGDGKGGSSVQAMVLRSFILAMSDRACDALVQWEVGVGSIPTDEPFLHSIRNNSYAFCLIAANRFADAQRILQGGRESHMRIGSASNLSVAMCLEGSINIARGESQHAIRRFRAALTTATIVSAHQATSGTIAIAFLAEALYYCNAIDEAGKLLDSYLPLLKEVAAPDQVITSYVTLARIAHLRGNAARATEMLDELEQLGHRQVLPRLASSASLERSRMALLHGDIATAARELHVADDERAWRPVEGMSMHANDVETLFVGRMRLMIHSGRADDAIAPLRDALSFAENQQRLRRAHTLRILLALALRRCGDEMGASKLLEEVQAFSDSSGMVRALADECEAAVHLIPRNALVAGAHKSADTAAVPERRQDTAARAGVDKLSQKEMRVLVLLSEGHANCAIAERLFVSESTVKTHLRKINDKLGAKNRTHAVVIARRLGLLRSP